MNRMQKYFRKGKSKMEIINRRSKCKDGRAIVVHNKGIVIGENDLKEDIEKDSTESSDSEDDEEQQFGVGTSKKNKNIEVSNEEEITIGNMVVENCNDEKENKRMKRKKNSREKSLVRKRQKRQREETMIAKTTGKKQSKSNKVLMKHMKTTKEEEEEEDNMEFFLLKENKSKYKRDDEEKEEGKNLMDEIERIKEGQREIMKQNEDIILNQHGNLVEVMAMLKQLSNEVHNIQGILNSDFMKKEEPSGGYSDNVWDDEEFIFQIDSNVKNYLIEKDIKLQKEREKQMLEVASKETTTEDFYLKQELMIERLVEEIKAQEEATTEEKLCMDETIKQDEAMLFSFEDEVVKDETMMMTFEDRVVKEKEMILSFKDIVGEVCKQAETKDASNGMKIDMTLDKMLKKTTNYMELPNFDIGID